MPLKGETLKAYNNLPAIPIEQPLGDLLNTIPVGDPALEAPAGGVATLYVDVAGSDDTGDGSQANPYATPQMAIDSIPATAGKGTEFIIRCGAGTFEFPDVSRIAEDIFVEIVGDTSNPIVSLPTGAVTFTRIPGQEAVWTANVGAFSPNITEGDFWVYRDGTSAATPGGYAYGYAPTASVSPDLNIVTRFNINNLPISVHAFSTIFTFRANGYVSGKDLGYVSTTLFRRIKFVGIKIVGEPDTGNNVLERVAFFGCSFSGGGTFTNFYFRDVYSYGCYLPPLSFFGVFYNSYHRYNLHRRGLQLEGKNIISTAVFSDPFTSLSLNTEASVSLLGSFNLEGSGQGIFLATAANLYSTADIFVANTQSSFIDSAPSYSALTSVVLQSGTVTGSVTGNAVELFDGSQALGVKAACNGTLTAGGSEIVVGGNGGQTFASLPATDLGAASPQLCRAT